MGEEVALSFIDRADVIIGSLMLFSLCPIMNAANAEKIISKEDADYIFSLNRAGWEAYARRMVHPDGWKVRLALHDTGTSVMAFDGNTNLGLSVQPLFGGDEGPPMELIVGSWYPLGFLPPFIDDFRKSLEKEAAKDLGQRYSVRASYTKVPPFEGIELTITRK